MAKSESIGNLAKALCEVQAAIAGAKKSSINPHFKSKYADLTEVWNACRDELTAAGLCVIQTNEPCERGVALRTTLIHTSGEWIDGLLELPAIKQDAQGYGSAQTYARRYGLAAIVGVTSDDDDGNAARNKDGNSSANRPSAPITATTGVLEKLDTDVQTFISDLSIEVLALAAQNKIGDAYFRIESEELDADQKVALWSLIKDSKIRSALKKFAENEKVNANG